VAKIGSCINVVVSRDFIASNDDVTTVVCAPIYREALGLRSEVLLGRENGLPRDSSIRCDFLTLMFKRKLTRFVSALSNSKVEDLNRALGYALSLGQ
jgi:mRNA-degrading endonuclease toxin of MazEF toxin-antitoxin module